MLNKEIAAKVKERKRMELDLNTLRSFLQGVARTRACFAGLSPEVIARQLTLIDSKLFRDIRVRSSVARERKRERERERERESASDSGDPVIDDADDQQHDELLSMAWSDKRLRHRSQHVRALIARQNKLTLWVATMILLPSEAKTRAKVLTKFITVAENLKAMNNFNTLMGIIAAINLSAVSRLRKTKALLAKHTHQSFSELEEVMNARSSWATYRQFIRNCTPPAVPYLYARATLSLSRSTSDATAIPTLHRGVFLTDLTFINDGNRDYIDDKINFKKQILIFKVLQEMNLYQTTKYDFPIENPAFTLLTALPALTEDELYTLSLEREPRETKYVGSSPLFFLCLSRDESPSLALLTPNASQGVTKRAHFR